MTVGLSTLPIELRIHILCQLSDISDLSAAIASHKSLSEAFAATSSSNSVLAIVLRNEIPDPRLWPLVLTIWQIRTSRKEYTIVDWKGAWYVLRECHSYDTDSAWEELCCVDLDKAREHIHGLHQAIQYFASDFLLQANEFLSNSKDEELLHTHIPTTNEIYRAQRSFYYYELFCLIWGNGQNVSAHRDLDVSCGMYVEFRPWMSEQVASVFEYLLREVSIVFDEVDANDMARKSSSLETPNQQMDKEKDFLISWGLQYFYNLTTTTTRCPNHEERYHMLNEKRTLQDEDGGFVLRTAFEELNWKYSAGYIYDPLENKVEDYMQKQRYMDEDDEDNSGPGPGVLWCSAHAADEDGDQFVFGPSYAAHRRAGYVMWDVERKNEFDRFLAELEKNSTLIPEPST